MLDFRGATGKVVSRRIEGKTNGTPSTGRKKVGGDTRRRTRSSFTLGMARGGNRINKKAAGKRSGGREPRGETDSEAEKGGTRLSSRDRMGLTVLTTNYKKESCAALEREKRIRGKGCRQSEPARCLSEKRHQREWTMFP